jgi:hypothetical protein
LRYLGLLCTMMLCVFLSGCVQSDTLVHVHPDGSGVIENTFMLPNVVINTFQGLTGSRRSAEGNSDSGDSGKAGYPDPIQQMMKMQSAETRYGPDVKFVSATPVKTGTMSGYKAIYKFKDINAIRINLHSENKPEKSSDGTEDSSNKEEMIRFSLVKGPLSTLTIMLPENRMDSKSEERVQKGDSQDMNKKASGADERQNIAKADPHAAEMIDMLFKDMRIRVAVEIDGKIISTNSTYRNESKLTLYDIDFGKFIENAKGFEAMTMAPPETVEEMMGLVKNLKGFEIEMNNPVVVTFQ